MMKQFASQTLLERGHSINRDEPRQTSNLPLQEPVREPSKAPDEILSAHERLDKRTHLMLNRSGAILAMGERARSEISQLCCFSIRDDHLVANKSDAMGPLRRLLELPQGVVESAMVPCHRVSGHVLLAATGLCTETVLLSIHVAAPGQGAQLVDLTEAFGLTPSEARIVELLLGGHGPAKISEALAISVHTVRAHLRHCYDKLGVSSREELWQALSPYQV